MLQRVFGQLPEWAQSDNLMLRYELRTHSYSSWVMIGIQSLLILGILCFISYRLQIEQVSTFNPSATIHTVLYPIALIVQVSASAYVWYLILKTSWQPLKRQHGDTVRTIRQKPRQLIYAKWVATIVRLSNFLILILIIRFIYILSLLYDLTAFRGLYLDLLLTGIEPQVSTAVGMILLSASMSAAILLPIVLLALEIAISLILSSLLVIPHLSIRISVIVIRIIIASVLVGFTLPVISPASFNFPDNTLSILALYIMGVDAGLYLLSLQSISEIWNAIPYSIFLGFGLMIVVLIFSALLTYMLNFSVRRFQYR